MGYLETCTSNDVLDMLQAVSMEMENQKFVTCYSLYRAQYPRSVIHTTASYPILFCFSHVSLIHIAPVLSVGLGSTIHRSNQKHIPHPMSLIKDINPNSIQHPLDSTLHTS